MASKMRLPDSATSHAKPIIREGDTLHGVDFLKDRPSKLF